MGQCATISVDMKNMSETKDFSFVETDIPENKQLERCVKNADAAIEDLFNISRSEEFSGLWAEYFKHSPLPIYGGTTSDDLCMSFRHLLYLANEGNNEARALLNREVVAGHLRNLSTEEIMNELRHHMVENLFVSVGGPIVAKIYVVQFGANVNDFSRFVEMRKTLPADPTIPEYRNASRNLFCLDPVSGRIHESVSNGFVLTRKEGYQRQDSGLVRKFGSACEELRSNSVYQAMLKFKAFLIEDVESVPRKSTNPEISAKRLMDMFYLDLWTTKDVLGKPAKEGVHSDGGQFAMTTIVHHTNIRTEDLPTTRIHTKDEETGAHWSKVMNSKHVIGSHQMRNFLDTLVFKDNEMKHSVSDIVQKNMELKAERSLTLIITKNQPVEGHATFGLDTTEPLDGGIRFAYK